MIKIGDKIDSRYRIDGRIGSGGMAEVYEAFDIIGKRIVAMKFMKEELIKDPEKVAFFRHEAASAARMMHENIVRVYDTGEYESRPYIVNEYIRGQTLREVIEFRGKFSPLEACELMVQLCNAVGEIHKHNLIHRDIKPDNIFYGSDNTVKLADFGIATSIDNEETKKDKPEPIMGSVHYMAPEIAQHNQASIQSDIYALGCTFFELLTSNPPFNGEKCEDVAIAHIKEVFPSTTKFGVIVAKEIETIVRKATRKNPKDRFDSADDMANAIKAALSNKNNFIQKKTIMQKIFNFK